MGLNPGLLTFGPVGEPQSAWLAAGQARASVTPPSSNVSTTSILPLW